MIVATAALLSCAAAAVAEAPPPSMSQAPRWLVTSALRSHPAGGIIGVEALVDQCDGIALGGFANYAYYWAELGPRIEHRFLDGFLISNLWLALEPGAFIPAAKPGDDRELGLRAVARARIELNLRFDRIWFYNRLTAEGRLRSFPERDPYRDAILDRELAIEEAFAPLVKAFSWGDRSAIWVYAELTVAAEASFGLLDFRPSGGVIAENIFDGVTIDLDVYRSLREGPIHGWGALMFVWWRL